MRHLPALLCQAIVALSIFLGTQLDAAPWKSDVSYGPHPNQKLDVYLPEGAGPFPVAIHIHGGAWAGGDKLKSLLPGVQNKLLSQGIAIVSINYRFLADGKKEEIFPPVLAPLTDAKRALQFVRSNAKEWNLNPNKVALFGTSAGAFSSLWVALSPDMAEANSADPVARQSTRVQAVSVYAAQTSIDPKQMREWVGPGLAYGGNAFGLSFEEFFNRREEFADWYSKLSPAALVSADDPPIFLEYRAENPAKPDYTHSQKFGDGFQKVALAQKAVCYLQYPGRTSETAHKDHIDFLIAELKK